MGQIIPKCHPQVCGLESNEHISKRACKPKKQCPCIRKPGVILLPCHFRTTAAPPSGPLPSMSGGTGLAHPHIRQHTLCTACHFLLPVYLYIQLIRCGVSKLFPVYRVLSFLTPNLSLLFIYFRISSLFLSLSFDNSASFQMTASWEVVAFQSLSFAAAAAKSPQSCPTLCDPVDGSPPGSPSLGFSRQEHWSGFPFPSPMHEREK